MDQTPHIKPTTTDVIGAARAYTAEGLAVIPVGRDKRPLVKGWQKARVGEHLASIRPGGNVGIVAGEQSGNLAFVEIDGSEFYTLFCQRFPHLINTRTVMSGGGGYHIYLRCARMPAETITYKPSKDEHREIKLKAAGQQCVAPPSIHPNGKPYLYKNDGPILVVDNLDDVVAWLRDLNGQASPAAPTAPRRQRETRQSSGVGGAKPPNPRLIDAIEAALVGLGFTYNTNEKGRWLNGRSLFRSEKHASFGVNLTTGYGWDFTGESYNTSEICQALNINPGDHGGLYDPDTTSTSFHPVQAARSANNVERIYAVVPDPILSACHKYLPKSSAPALYVTHQAARDGLLDPDCVTLPALLEVQHVYNTELPESTWRGVLSALDGIFLRKTDGGKEHSIYQSKIRGNSLGRRATVYQMTPIAEHNAALLSRARCRIYEDVANDDTTNAPILLEPRPGMLEAIGVDATDAPTVAAELNRRYEPAYEEQGHAEKRAAQRATHEYRQLQFDLQNKTTTPLPSGWVIRSAADFQAARLRGLVEANPGHNFSYQEMVRFLGVARSALPTLLKRAGLENEYQEATAELTPAEPVITQVRRAASEARGRPFEIVAKYDDDRIAFMAYDRDTEPIDAQRFVASHTARGASVVVKMRVASRQNIVEAEQPEYVPVARPAAAPVVTAADKTDAPPRYYGDGYSPQFVYAQFAHALERLDGLTVTDSGSVVTADGEIIHREATALDLLDLILNGPPMPIALDDGLADLLAFAVEELGARVRSCEMISHESEASA